MSMLFYDAQTKYVGLTTAAQVWDSCPSDSLAMSTSETPYSVGRSVAIWSGQTEAKAWKVTLPSTAGYTKIRFGFWMRDTNSFNECYIGFRSVSAQRLCQLAFETNGNIEAQRGYYNTSNTLIKRSSISNTRYAWRWYEGYVGFGNSTGFFYLRINNRQAISATGVDTIAGSTAAEIGAREFLATAQTGNGNTKFKDFMVWDDAGDWPTGWIGPVRTDELLPDGDGTHSDWTLSSGSSGWSLIDSVTLSTSDYISSTSTGNESSFDIEARPSEASGIVRAVSAEFWAASVGGGSTEIAVGLIDASTQAYKTAEGVATPRRVVGFFPTRPGSTTAWSSTDIAALEVSVRHG